MEPIHRITYSELVDIPKLQTLMDSFYQVIGVANAVLDVDGTILAGAGWQFACTGFIASIRTPAAAACRAIRRSSRA